MPKIRRNSVPAHAALARSRGGLHRARRGVISLLSLGLLTAGVVAGVGTVNSAPANADTGPNLGYYTSQNGISGFCVDPGKQTPESQPYEIDRGYFGSDQTKVLSWMAMHFGPTGAGYDNDGGAFYPSHPVLQGVSAASAGLVTTAIGHDAVRFEGKTPIHASGTSFEPSLYAFAAAHPGPWDLTIALDSPAPYVRGGTYDGHLAIDDRDGHRVPVGGINVQATGQSGISLNMNPSGNNPRHVTNVNGALAFTFTVSSNPNGANPFDAQFNTNDVAGRARIYEPTNHAIFASFQRLLGAAAASSSASLRGFVTVPGQTFGAIAVGKVDEGVTRGLAGAEFDVYNSTSATPVAHLVTGADGRASSGLLPTGVYRVKEVVAPPGYLLNTTDTDPNLAFHQNQIGGVNPNQMTNFLFADHPAPGTLNIGKAAAGLATIQPLAGATYQVHAGDLNGPVVATVSTDGSGIASAGGLAPGTYTVIETVAPPGYTLNTDPQIRQVLPGQTQGMLFLNKHQASLSTEASTQSGIAGEVVTDTINIANSGLADGSSYHGPVNWTLLGPVAGSLDTAGSPTCAGADFTGAPTASSGVVNVRGDGPYVTDGFTLVGSGCYTYTELLVGNDTTSPFGPTTPGAVTESFIAFQHRPAVSTLVSKQVADLGDTIVDAIKVEQSGSYNGPVRWTLYGPLAAPKDAVDKETCAGLNWSAAPIADSGEITVNGDGTYPTPGHLSSAYGCYTYTEYLVGDVDTAPAGPSIAGEVTETSLTAKPQPLVSTMVSNQRALPGATIHDTITVTDSKGYRGRVYWTLHGPVAPLASPTGPTCVGVVWTGAAIEATDMIVVLGDGAYRTQDHVVAAEGCYTYTEFLPGNATTASAGPSVAGDVTETALIAKATPAVSTQISAQNAETGDTLTDNIAVTGSQGYQGRVNWVLFGPVAPTLNAAGSPTCVGLSWAGAATAASGVVMAHGDGTYVTAGFAVPASGCYTYSELLVGNATTTPAGPSTPGTVSETVLVVAHIPALSTQISAQQALIGDTITDNVIVTGSFGYQGPVTWMLLGPVAPTLNSAGSPTCVGVDYANAETAASGSVTVNGDNTYPTAGFTVVTTGCYTYTELLVGNASTGPVGPTTPGLSTETVIVFVHAPIVSTQISQQKASAGDVIRDSIKVSGSAGYVGPVNWTLLGPVEVKHDAAGVATCTGVSWAAAPTAAGATVTVHGDGTYVTAGFTVHKYGCYTYVELLVGDSTTAPAGPSTPGTPSETVVVTTAAVSGISPPLAVTGSDVGITTLAGLGLLAAGGTLMLVTRRRRRPIAR